MTTARNAADLAPNTNDADGTDVRLSKLVRGIHSHAQHQQKPALALDIEIDGASLSQMQASTQSYSCELPPWSRSLCLRDEEGTMRAHVLLQEQTLTRANFDHGRLLVSTQRNDDGTLQLTLERQQHDT